MRRVVTDRLNRIQKAKIRLLLEHVSASENRKVDLPLPDTGEICPDELYFLAYEKGVLVSFIQLFFPDGVTGDILGATDPAFCRKGYFSSLLSLAEEYADSLELKDLYLLDNHRSLSWSVFREKHFPVLSFEESLLKKDLSSCPVPEEYALLPSLPSDIVPLLSRIFDYTEEAAKNYVQDVTDVSSMTWYRLIKDKVSVGTACATKVGDMTYLCAFGILPEYRKQGIGKNFLTAFEQSEQKKGQKCITLEVSSKNVPASRLYFSAGYLSYETVSYYKES